MHQFAHYIQIMLQWIRSVSVFIVCRTPVLVLCWQDFCANTAHPGLIPNSSHHAIQVFNQREFTVSAALITDSRSAQTDTDSLDETFQNFHIRVHILSPLQIPHVLAI